MGRPRWKDPHQEKSQHLEKDFQPYASSLPESIPALHSWFEAALLIQSERVGQALHFFLHYRSSLYRKSHHETMRQNRPHRNYVNQGLKTNR